MKQESKSFIENTINQIHESATILGVPFESCLDMIFGIKTHLELDNIKNELSISGIQLLLLMHPNIVNCSIESNFDVGNNYYDIEKIKATLIKNHPDVFFYIDTHPYKEDRRIFIYASESFITTVNLYNGIENIFKQMSLSDE